MRTEAASDLLEAAAAANPLEDSIEDRSLGSRKLLETKEDPPPPLTTDSFLLANCSSSSLRAAAAAAVGVTAISNREEREIRWCLGGAGVWRADGEKEIFFLEEPPALAGRKELLAQLSSGDKVSMSGKESSPSLLRSRRIFSFVDVKGWEKGRKVLFDHV